MKKNTLFLAGFLSLISLTAFSQQDIAVKKGQKFEVETVTKLSSSAQVMGQSMETTTDSKTITAFEVSDTRKDGADLISTIKKITASMNAMGQSASYDSDKTDNSGPLADALGDKVNKATKLSIDNKGKIVSQSQEDELAIPGISTSGTKTDLFIPALLNKKLAVGDMIADSNTVKKEKHDSKTSGTYTVKSVDNNVATVLYTGKQVVSETMEQMGMEMINNATNVINSTIIVDLKTGMVISNVSDIQSESTIEAAGMQIPASSKTTVTTTVKAI